MKIQKVFARYETKYLITKEQKQLLTERFKEHMEPDKFGRSTVCSLYYDTPDSLLIRRSLEKPVYKEKFRLRSYGTPTPDSTVFAEIKKKYKSVVYKRRILMPESEATAFLAGCAPCPEGQIAKEIDFFFKRYAPLVPAMFICCEREAYYGRQDGKFRITFDENIRYRDYDLSLLKGTYGSPMLDDDTCLMEIKCDGGIPLWMVNILSEQKIYKRPFSKYGNAYRKIMTRKRAQ